MAVFDHPFSNISRSRAFSSSWLLVHQVVVHLRLRARSSFLPSTYTCARGFLPPAQRGGGSQPIGWRLVHDAVHLHALCATRRAVCAGQGGGAQRLWRAELK
eukprot:CAMPEP_0184389612 /NCGR_PEP_ID=MMETSP0007-20130409/12634_1 /TAXON_ID=97485 /ORGANISM="Prymnesium parvum, Strain Texoma1" /LENGTH=101 /DNA_ID=CAMNT_0026739019 /DNA_START=65 /DNA_END=367 /DNA_ORIENTATION=-